MTRWQQAIEAACEAVEHEHAVRSGYDIPDERTAKIVAAIRALPEPPETGEEELVEAMAVAICEGGTNGPWKWERQSEAGKGAYRQEARAALAVVRAHDREVKP